MRFRVDSWSAAEDVTRIARGERSHFLDHMAHLDPARLAELRATPPAQPGDVWRVRWYAAEGEGPIAGYAIGCPTCGLVHSWTTANGCAAGRRAIEGSPGHTVCEHSGVGSCWTWSGSAESNLLTAAPSLHCVLALGGCGFHGFLENGQLRHC